VDFYVFALERASVIYQQTVKIAMNSKRLNLLGGIICYVKLITVHKLGSIL